MFFYHQLLLLSLLLLPPSLLLLLPHLLLLPTAVLSHVSVGKYPAHELSFALMENADREPSYCLTC